jgi:hypothetical protein
MNLIFKKKNNINIYSKTTLKKIIYKFSTINNSKISIAETIKITDPCIQVIFYYI